MKELRSHAIYELLENKYPRVVLDYVVLSADRYAGIKSHKDAVVKALEIIGRRYDCIYDIAEDKMRATISDADYFLKLLDDDYYHTKPKMNRGYDIPDVIPYWYAFLNPPYGNQYLTKDFVEFKESAFRFYLGKQQVAFMKYGILI